MSYLLEILGQGLLTELLAAFRTVLPPADQASCQTLKDAVRQPGATAADYVRLGACFLHQRDVIGAKAVFAKAVDVAPDDRTARIGLACALDELGRTEEAVENLRVAHQRAPHDATVLFALGYCSEKTAQTDSAIGYYTTALQVCPGLRNARERLAAIHVKDGDLDAAIQQYERICEAESGEATPLLTLANLCYQRGRFVEAIHFYQEALLIDPDNWGARDDLVEAYAKADRIEDAVEELQARIEKEPAFPDNHLPLGDLYPKLGDDTVALEQYEHAVELFRETGLEVATGRFQEYMQVRLQNDGPVTILLDSDDRRRSRRS